MGGKKFFTVPSQSAPLLIYLTHAHGPRVWASGFGPKGEILSRTFSLSPFPLHSAIPPSLRHSAFTPPFHLHSDIPVSRSFLISPSLYSARLIIYPSLIVSVPRC